jgi:hypothetical protein
VRWLRADYLLELAYTPKQSEFPMDRSRPPGKIRANLARLSIDDIKKLLEPLFIGMSIVCPTVKGHFVYRGRLLPQWPISPLRKGEKIRVTALASTQACVHQIVVRGQWGGRSLGVPLAQLKLVGTDKATAQAIADWHYWVAHENDF